MGMPEFSRPKAVAELAGGDYRFNIRASEDERSALARRFGILAIDSLEAAGQVSPSLGGIHVRLAGTLRADVQQACVVTLEPVAATVEHRFDRTFGPQDSFSPGAEVMISADEEDPPDPIEEGVIDIGEVIAEELSLALDPFPRSPGAAFDGHASAGDDASTDDETNSPFARLAELKRK